MSGPLAHPDTGADSFRAPGARWDAPQPGVPEMPPWDAGQLGPAPIFTWRNWPLLIGPGLVSGAAAIGGGEWLTGPMNAARYGGALLWLATLSIVAQVIYNLEICRYTLYCGEPIFTGKFRTLPGPLFWLVVYLVLDFGSFLPYLASHAAIPVGAILLGELPDPQHNPAHAWLLKGLACGLFLLVLVPLVVGGKIYNSLKVMMTFKLVVVLGFLLFLAVFFSKPATWIEIGRGFLQIGTVPV